MPTRSVNMFEATSQLSQLVDAVESGAASEIIIARNGKPAARLMPVQEPTYGQRLGLLEGRYPVAELETINQDDAKIVDMFFSHAHNLSPSSPL